MEFSAATRHSILNKLELLYGEHAAATLERVEQLASTHADSAPTKEPVSLWDETSSVLITYGDQVRGDEGPTLEHLREFLLEFGLDDLLSSVHILPCFPYSSDDGFSVIDYRTIDPKLGDWSDVARLSESFGLMFDFVVNHCSQHSEWFQAYRRGEEPYVNYFIEADPNEDLSAVTRPRSLPLLTPVETNRGTKHVWTTFSDDQIDLNFASPDVLIEALDILLLYVRQGARLIRLDAIGFLWKEIGTNCMHLPETHAAVKLMREVLETVAPGTIVITETNVPHDENVSYFGDGDEAHAVYQFSLAPLLLDAFLTGDATPLKGWLSQLDATGKNMTYFNFTASHDGIGVRPLEGLVTEKRRDELVDSVSQRGGLVSTRRKPDGSDSPYELNITYFSALNSPEGLPAEQHAARFLASQAVMLSLRGIPGIYFHSLVGTPNYHEGVEETGRNRTINRRKFDRDELRSLITAEDSQQRLVFEGYCRLLKLRREQPAFHPDAPQVYLTTEDPALLAFRRTSLDATQQLLVLSNFSDENKQIDLSQFTDAGYEKDLISDVAVEGNSVALAPWTTVWLI